MLQSVLADVQLRCHQVEGSDILHTQRTVHILVMSVAYAHNEQHSTNTAAIPQVTQTAENHITGGLSYHQLFVVFLQFLYVLFECVLFL